MFSGISAVPAKIPETITTPSLPFEIFVCAKPRTGNVAKVPATDFATVVLVEYPVAYTGSPFVINAPLLFLTSYVK